MVAGRQRLLSNVFFTKIIKAHNYFFMTALFNFFIRQTLADDLDDFLESHKYMNCAFLVRFPLFNQGSLTFLV